jgi:hypothetical protein
MSAVAQQSKLLLVLGTNDLSTLTLLKPSKAHQPVDAILQVGQQTWCRFVFRDLNILAKFQPLLEYENLPCSTVEGYPCMKIAQPMEVVRSHLANKENLVDIEYPWEIFTTK